MRGAVPGVLGSLRPPRILGAGVELLRSVVRMACNEGLGAAAAGRRGVARRVAHNGVLVQVDNRRRCTFNRVLSVVKLLLKRAVRFSRSDNGRSIELLRHRR